MLTSHLREVEHFKKKPIMVVEVYINECVICTAIIKVILPPVPQGIKTLPLAG